jgi:flavin reductase (DIM6/NTAB) family NADH-FMN oxidoreductase RutF
VAGRASDGPIGPFPAGVETPEQRDEYDRMRRRALWTMPSGLYLIGSGGVSGGPLEPPWDAWPVIDGRLQPHFMTANWATQVSFEPKLLAVGIEKPALTHRLISEGRVFSLNTIDREDRAVVRKFTKPVEVDLEARTANGFAFHDGPTGAPIFDQAVAWFDCEVRETVEVGDTTLFIGEIVGCGFQKAEDTPVLRMEDTRMNYGG